MNTRSLFFAALVAAVSIGASACANDRADPPPETTAPADAGPLVRIEPAMESSVRVETISLRTTPRTVRATGRVHLDDAHVARLVAPVAGQVVGLRVNVGDRVERGAPLFFINSRDAASAIEDDLDSRRDLELAEKTLKMTEDLFEHQAASKIALDQARNDALKARARVERTERALRAIGLRADADGGLDPRVPVSSPVNGVVLERHASDGQYVQPDPTPLLTVANLSTVWVEADLFERDLHLVHVGDAAEVATAAYPDRRFRARVARISDVVDPATRTLKVRFVTANPDLRLKPEMFATVTLFVSETQTAITVPPTAVLTEGTNAFVYVALDHRTFARRRVELAPDTSGDARCIVKGVRPGDRVVTSGAVLLRGHEDLNAR